MNFKLNLIIFLFFPIQLIIEYPHNQLIVWNVGQGQWATLVRGADCWHFDFGGERNPIKSVYPICHWRQNHLVLSHGDRDHFSFLNSLKTNFKNICLDGHNWSSQLQAKMKVTGIKTCDLDKQNEFDWYVPLQNKFDSDDNKKSQIVQTSNWLIPGDAPQKNEHGWLTLKHKVEQIRYLLLGHHGSRTSTSNELIERLSNLRQCIASSRLKKYGHPHREVVQKLRGHCALLRTEEWGHLHFYLNNR